MKQHEETKRDATCPDEGDNFVNNSPKVPDGGYGWFCVLGSFLNHFIIGGIERSTGLLYLELEQMFPRSSASAMSWVFSLNTALRQCLGPIVGMLCNRFSCRTVVIVGGILSCIGLLFTAFILHLEFLYFSFGILTGTGFAFAYAPSVVIVGLYFCKNRGKAVGISVSGVGVGGFTVPPLTEALLSFYGYTGSLVILAGIGLNLCIGGALFRPLKDPIIDIVNNIENERQTSVDEIPSGDDLNNRELNGDINGVEEHRDDVSNGQNGKMLPMAATRCSSKENEQSCFRTFKQRYLDVSLLLDIPFLSFCVGMFLFSLAFQASLVFLPALAKERGIPQDRLALMLALAGGCDAFGRVLAGVIFDQKNIVPVRLFLYNLDVFLVAMVTFLCTFVWSFPGFMVISGFYGLVTGMYISQKSVVIVDLVGQRVLKSSFGLLIWFQGIGSLVGPPLAGAFRDRFGKYDESFYFGSSVTLLAAVIMLMGNILKRKRRCTE